MVSLQWTRVVYFYRPTTLLEDIGPAGSELGSVFAKDSLDQSALPSNHTIEFHNPQTTSAMLSSTEDYAAASFRSTESEKVVQQSMGRPEKSSYSRAMTRRKKTKRTSR